MRLDYRILNLISELKSDDIWPHFGHKTVKNWQNRLFCQFLAFLLEKMSQMLSDFKSETRFGILSSRRICYTQEWKGLKSLIFTLIVISKLWLPGGRVILTWPVTWSVTPSIGGGTFSGKGGTPSQGWIEEIFKAATIYHCVSTLNIPIFKNASVFGHCICLAVLF